MLSTRIERGIYFLVGIIVVCIGVFAFAGCATTLPMNPTDMSPEQIKEAVKDKSMGIGCVTILTPYRGNSVFMNLDKGVLLVGKFTIAPDCTITYEAVQMIKQGP